MTHDDATVEIDIKALSLDHPKQEDWAIVVDDVSVQRLGKVELPTHLL